MTVARKNYGWGHGLGAPPPRDGDAGRDCIEVGECRPRHRSAKNKRDWCKGRVGIPHTWEWLLDRGTRERELRFGIEYNRMTEQPVCFGCGRIDFKFRHYCRLCGEPWPEIVHGRTATGFIVEPCVRCGAPWSIRHRVAGVYIASGSVLR